jgi:hypothetical protein
MINQHPPGSKQEDDAEGILHLCVSVFVCNLCVIIKQYVPKLTVFRAQLPTINRVPY